ncbi:MAG: GPP34 family phosphoprotein [Bacteroidales bacterium]|nr:GPP34 family phosphoprotein [Bacteroidales bacterium]
MYESVLRSFIIFALDAGKGRFRIDSLRLRYSVAGAILLDLLRNNEITVSEKRVIPSLRRNGDPVHDTVAEMIENQSRHRKVSFWISRLSWKSRFFLNETLKRMSSAGIIRHERKLFLGFFPYNRWYISDIRIQTEIYNSLRRVLLSDEKPSKEVEMLISVIRASESAKLIARNREEKRIVVSAIKNRTHHDSYEGGRESPVYIIQKAVISAISASSAASTAAATSG